MRQQADVQADIWDFEVERERDKNEAHTKQNPVSFYPLVEKMVGEYCTLEGVSKVIFLGSPTGKDASSHLNYPEGYAELKIRDVISDKKGDLSFRWAPWAPETYYAVETRWGTA